MANLYIYSGVDTKSVEDDFEFSYYLNTATLHSDSIVNINNQVKLNKIAEDHSLGYSDFVFSQNTKFVDSYNILDKNLSLFFLSDLSCKRTEIFETYSNYCNSVLIKESIDKYKITNILFDGCSEAFIESCTSTLSGISYKAINVAKNAKRTKYILMRNTHFFLSVIISRSLEGLLFLNRKKIFTDGSKKYFLTRYPLHLNDNFVDDKYGDLVTENDNLLVNIMTDGIHQHVRPLNYIKHVKYLRRSSRVHILDSYIKLKDVIKGMKYMFKISRSFKSLYKKSYIFNGVDISTGVCDEISLSILRIPRLIMLGEAIRDFASSNSINELYYYLHEYSYGKLFTYIFSSYYPDVKLVGYQHGPSSRRKMVYLNGKNELRVDSNGIDSFYLPKMVLAEDSYSADLYKESGYRNVKLMDRVYRLSYLKNIQRKESDKNYVLIVPGLHDGRHLLETMKHDILLNTKDTYILKPHPRASNNYIGDYSYIENLTVSNSHISKLLGMAKKVIVTYSSVAIEAKILGIDVELVEVPGRVNESPLIDGDFLSCIQNIKY